MTIHQLTHLRSLRERREQRARWIVEEFRRAEIEPRQVVNVMQTELAARRATRNQAAESLFLGMKAQTNVADQVGARAGLARIDQSVEAGGVALQAAQNALDIVVEQTRHAEARLRIARNESEKCERGIERQMLLVRKEGLSAEEAALDEQTDAHVMVRHVSAIYRSGMLRP